MIALGNQKKTIVDDNETCPIGQLHIWSFKKVNFKVFVLGDEYASNIDYNASTRFFAVKKNDENKESKFGGFIGIGLGNTDKEVETKLEKFVKDNPIYTYSKEPGISPVHGFLLPFTSFKYQYILSDKNNDLYFYFLINKNGVLEVIVQTNFNVLAAC